MDITDYVHNGKVYKASPTTLDSNTFFHAAFGIRPAEGDEYLDKKAKSRRMRWASFLAHYEDEAMPSSLADVLNKCLAANNKYEHASVEDQGCLEDYISDILRAEQDVTAEEIPVLATLENIKIVLLVNGRSAPLVINPDRGILGSYSSSEHFKGEVLLCLDGNVFSRLNLIEESFSRPVEDAVAEVKQNKRTTEQFNISSTRYKKGGSAGSKGVQFQVGLLTVFFLNAIQKLSNWRLSTENTAAGKFDDVVLEWAEGATLLQAKYKQNKTKKITLDDLISTNSKNDDFSLPKYFLSFEEVKKTFPLKNVILCTNASVDGKAMRFLEPQDVLSESLLHWKDYECKFYTFSDDILPYLREGVRSYYEKNSRNKNVEESTVSDENMTAFLRCLQFYSGYPAENDIGKVTEQLLSHLKSSKSLYGEMTPLEVHTKVLEWFQKKEGTYLTEFTGKAIFSEICRDRVWQKLERYDVFFKKNLTFQTSHRILHVITENGLHLLQELKIFRALQQDKKNILYVKVDDDIMTQRHTIDAFQLPKYTILVIILPEIMEEFMKEDIRHKLGHILTEFTYKKVILVADRSNALPQFVSPCGIIIEPGRFDDLAKKSQEALLEKKCVLFQGRNVSLSELLATHVTEDYGTFLDSEVMEKLIRGEKIKVGLPPSDLLEDIPRCYIRRNFKKAPRSAIEPVPTFSEEAICETDEMVVLISDSAGTGKSTVLTSLASRIKQMNPQLWVLRINLNNYTEILRKYLNTNKETIHIVDLLNSTNSTKLTNHLEKSVFSMKGKVVLMLDGFDEICPDFTGLVLGLLSTCRGQLNFAKLIVTTRPHMAGSLEKILQVKSFALEPFTQQNQTDCLINYWVHNLNATSVEKFKCQQYAEALMRTMPFWMKWDQLMSNSFAAIPLHVRMLAEIFEERNRLEYAADWEGCKEFLTADRLEPKLPDDMNITRLYKMFVEKKRSVFIDKGNPTGNTAANQALINQFGDCLACHRSLALELVLNEGECKLFSCYRQTPNNLATNILKIGIVQKLSPFPLFVHRTFAEYFVAESLVEELKCSNRDIKFQKLLIEQILFESAFNDVRVFLDGFLQHVVDELPTTIFRKYQATSYSLPTNMRQLNLLHDLADKGYVATLKLILTCMDSNCMGSNCVDSDFLMKLTAYFKYHFIEHQPEQFYSNILNFLHTCIHLKGLNFTPPFGDKILLECASENGRLEMVQFLVNRGADVNAGLHKPLQLALLHNRFEVFKFLVERGAETDGLKYSPAYMAIESNYQLIAAYLLERMLKSAGSETDPLIAYTAAYLGRADVLEEQMRRGLDIDSRVDQNETLVFGAARGGQPEVIKYLVRQGCDVNFRDCWKNTALMMPIRPSTAQVLAELGIDVNAVNSHGNTALYIAVNRFDFDLVEVLVANGANVNLGAERGRTPICIAAMNLPVSSHTKINMHPRYCSTQLDTIRLLMKNGADANIKDSRGASPLHLAVVSGSLDAVVLLMEYKIDVNVRDRDDRTALHLAVLWNHADVAKFLVQHNADTNIRDNSGQTIVHYLASSTGNLYSFEDRLDIIRLVLNSGGHVDSRDHSGRTALHWATKTNFLDCVVLLVESGADLNVRDVKGNTALHLAVHPQIIEYLVTRGVNMTAKNNSGQTALHLVAKIGLITSPGNETYTKPCSPTKKRSCLEITKILISHSSSVVEIKNATGSTALHLAAMAGNREIVRFLLENKADVHARDGSGRTALHLAAEMGKLDVVELLLDFGVDFKTRDNEGCTALELAARKRFRSNIINMLVAHEDKAAVNFDDHLATSSGA